ncbi:hypothetical protein OG21DRAFT_131814 [Imleria badia]|nr:hypothetical protein OG21DRAFT_131814 [Imleria badia]
MLFCNSLSGRIRRRRRLFCDSLGGRVRRRRGLLCDALSSRVQRRRGLFGYQRRSRNRLTVLCVSVRRDRPRRFFWYMRTSLVRRCVCFACFFSLDWVISLRFAPEENLAQGGNLAFVERVASNGKQYRPSAFFALNLCEPLYTCKPGANWSAHQSRSMGRRCQFYLVLMNRFFVCRWLVSGMVPGQMVVSGTGRGMGHSEVTLCTAYPMSWRGISGNWNSAGRESDRRDSTKAMKNK